jgi:hypothetical protein
VVRKEGLDTTGMVILVAAHPPPAQRDEHGDRCRLLAYRAYDDHNVWAASESKTEPEADRKFDILIFSVLISHRLIFSVLISHSEVTEKITSPSRNDSIYARLKRKRDV